ncbi:unnamed protein product, partial [Nesidiocoris tenuis]
MTKSYLSFRTDLFRVSTSVLGAKEISTGGSGATPAETLYIRLYILAEKTVGQFNGGGRQFPSSGRGASLTGKGFLLIE